MSEIVYTWKRFWCSRDGNINLGDGGYLSDPEDKYGRIMNPDVRSFQEISSNPCLVMLGEPGIGKSKCINDEFEKIILEIKGQPAQAIFINLGDYPSDTALSKDLFESSEFISWLESENFLYLFLDSLDEGKIHIKPLTKFLLSKLRSCPIDRLILRISCRTFGWPETFGRQLRQLWEEDFYAEYELTPLRRKDVIEAAKINEINSGLFIKEINKKEVTSLAIKPVTLNFLVNLYKRDNNLLKNRWELYYEGCRYLCEESEERRDAGIRGKYTTDQKFFVASCIAALTTFANKTAICSSTDKESMPLGDFFYRDLIGRTELGCELISSINEELVEETLDTGLFSSRGAYRIGWAHQTYSEFLAACFVHEQKLDTPQVMSLLLHPDRKLVPQLYEVSAWVATKLPYIFKELIEIDPDVLLRSDLALTEEENRVSLVQNLLKCFDAEKLFDTPKIRKYYEKLNNPSLHSQLLPYLINKNKSLSARRAAIEIAEDCNVLSLMGDIVNIAFDTKEEYRLRVSAVQAVSRIGSKDDRGKLIPFYLGSMGEDPYDSMKVAGLEATWPDHLTTDEMFLHLTPPQNDNYVGSYYMFITQDLLPKLQPSDIPAALTWLAKIFPLRGYTSRFDKTFDGIILKALQHLDIPKVLENLVDVIIAKFKEHRELVKENAEAFNEFIRANTEIRRQLIRRLIIEFIKLEMDCYHLASYKIPICIHEDIPWVIEKISESKTEKEQGCWSKLLWQVYDYFNPEFYGLVSVVYIENEIFKKACNHFFDPVPLASKEAKKQKENYYKDEQSQKINKDRNKLNLIGNITKYLEKIDFGEILEWHSLVYILTKGVERGKDGDPWKTDLTELPGWQIIDEVYRKRILESAKMFLENHGPREDILEAVSWNVKDISGLKAFRLLEKEAHGYLETIDAKIIQRWVPSLLSLSDYGDKNNLQKNLICKAYLLSPEKIIEHSLVIIDREIKANGNFVILKKFESCWDERLSLTVLDKLNAPEVAPNTFYQLLEILFENDKSLAEAFSDSFVEGAIPTDAEDKEKAVIAVTSLLNFSENSIWPLVWAKIQAENDFAHKVIERMASRGNKVIGKLKEKELADLYIYLTKEYPDKDDPPLTGGPLNIRHNISDFKRDILNSLETQGSIEALMGISRIIKVFPGETWLKWVFYKARTNTIQNTWLPPEPTHIIKLADNQETQLVQSHQQLMEIVIQSLDRLEKKLHQHTPAIRDIWDHYRNDKADKCKPVDENSFSDYVKRHLHADLVERGIIANREVEVRGGGKGRGDTTDIHIVAVVKDQRDRVFDSITLIIETKGCWHKNLKKAMEAQLYGQYMMDSECKVGIYLVGWFSCEKWNQEDYRKGDSPQITLKEAKEFFGNQAANISSRYDVSIKPFIMDTAMR